MTATAPGATIGGRDATRVGIASAIAAGTGLVVVLLSARVLAPDDSAVFLTFWSTLFAFFGVLSGISIETTRAVSAASPADPPGRPRVVLVAVVVGLVLGALVALTVPLWSGSVFPASPWALGALVAVGAAGNAVHTVLVGALAGQRLWKPYSALVAADSVVRLLLIALSAVLGATVLGFAGGAAAASATWLIFVLVSPRVRSAAGARADSTLPVLLRRHASAATATGASALLVVGFPMLLSLTTGRAEMALAAPLITAITLTRAPLMIPLNAYQGVAVTHFVAHRDSGLRALLPIVRAVAAVGAFGAVLAALVGPWIMQTLLGEVYRVDGRVLGGLVVGATLLALVTLTGALCQALTLHRVFVGGWITAVVVAVLVLMLPGAAETRAVAALVVGPTAGVVVHVLGLRRAAASGVAAVPDEIRDPAADDVREGSDEAATASWDATETAATAVAPAAPEPVRVSVCMATYNGSRFVEEQLRSILEQLGTADEVVVVDDASTDDTVARVRSVDDPRVHLVEAPRNRGYVRTFEDALSRARGEVVLLSDQDDLWVDGRVETMVRALADVEVVATNLGTLGGPDAIRGPYGQPDWHLRAADSRRHARNVLGTLAGNRPYYGCAMGLRRDALSRVLPFPAFLDESHDLWIALYGNVAGSIRHVETRTVLRRFHEDNASPNRPRGPVAVLRSRLMLVRAVMVLRGRRRR